MTGYMTDVEGCVDVGLPDPMLLPLIEVAADVLKDLELSRSAVVAAAAARLRPPGHARRARAAPDPASPARRCDVP